MSANEFAAMIVAMKNKKADVVPNEFKTAVSWSKIHQVSPPNIHRYLREALDSGFMEMKKFNIQQDSGLRSVNHYKIIKAK